MAASKRVGDVLLQAVVEHGRNAEAELATGAPMPIE